MASNVRITLDHRGIGELLKSPEVAALMLVKAAEVQAIAETHHSIRKHELPIERQAYETSGPRMAPRAAEGVAIAHAAGKNVEAKYGVLVHAAALAGLEVTANHEDKLK
jgi:hypothetical protein